MNRYLKKILPFFIMVLCAYIGWKLCSDKRVFLLDEPFSYALSNEPTLGWIVFDPKGWYSGSWFKDFGVTYAPFNYSQVFINQAGDVHPPLYYLILHTICSLTPGRITVWQGLIINYVSFLINCAVLYYLVRKTTRSEPVSSAAILLYALNLTTFDGIVFLRMYQLCSTFLLLFAAFGLRIVTEEEFSIPCYIMLILTVISGGLTHYFFYYGLLFLCAAMGIALLASGKWKRLIVSAAGVVTAACLNLYVIFPATYDHLFSAEANGEHGQHALNALLGMNFDRSRYEYFISESWGGRYMFYGAVILLIAALILSITKKDKRLIPGITATSAYLFNTVLVSQTATFVISRYSYPMEVVGMFGVIALAYSLLSFFPLKAIVRNMMISSMIIVLTLYNTNLHRILEPSPYIPSWTAAEMHSGRPCVVIVDEDTDSADLSALFLDFQEYSAVGFIRPGETLHGYVKEDFVVYIEKTIPEADAYAKIKELADGAVISEISDVYLEKFRMYEVRI